MNRLLLCAVGAVVAAGLAGCGDKTREAESKTPVAEAEVQTQLPSAAVSDQTLQQSADQAAAQASMPAPGTTTAPTTTTPGAAPSTGPAP